MKKTVRSEGFTLIEVALSIVLGVLILGGVIVLYNQVKLSTGNAKAREKELALSQMVEEFAAKANRYPRLAELNTLWSIKRPEDYTSSPWGGALQPSASTSSWYIDGNDNVSGAPPIVYGDGESNLGLAPGGTANISDAGKMYYFMSPTSQQFFIDDFSAADSTGSGSCSVRGYGVSYIGPQGQRWWFVSGKELRVNVPVVAAAQGQVGGP